MFDLEPQSPDRPRDANDAFSGRRRSVAVVSRQLHASSRIAASHPGLTMRLSDSAAENGIMSAKRTPGLVPSEGHTTLQKIREQFTSSPSRKSLLSAPSTPIFHQIDTWLHDRLQTTTKPQDVTRVAEHMQEVLSDRTVLVSYQHAKIRELEELCIEYVHKIDKLNEKISNTKHSISSEKQAATAAIEAALNDSQLNGGEHLNVQASPTRQSRNLEEAANTDTSHSSQHATALCKSPLPAQIQTLCDAFKKRIFRTERLLKAQTNANAELANRIQNLELVTKLRIQKDAEYMEELQEQLREQKTAALSLLQTKQDQQKDLMISDRVFKDWLQLRVVVPKRLALPFGRWALQRYLNMRFLVVTSRSSKKLNNVVVVPFFLIWSEFTAQHLAHRRCVNKIRNHAVKRYLRRSLICWRNRVFQIHQAVSWSLQKFKMINLNKYKQSQIFH